MASENDIRRQLIAEHGRCTCPSGGCVEDDGTCAVCAAMDPYWSCFHDDDDPWPPHDDLIAGAAASSVDGGPGE